MPKITTAIGEAGFELVRNRIGEILVTELTEQHSLNPITGVTNATVYIERFRSFDNVEVPAVNVTIATDEFGQRTAVSGDGTVTYHIDCYTSAPTTSAVAGDTSAMVRLQRILGICRTILMDSRYITLDFAAPFIMSRAVTSMQLAKPVDATDGLSMVMGRLVMTVRMPEQVSQATLEEIGGYDTQVKMGLTDKGYVFSGDNIPVPPVTGSEISVNGTFYFDLDCGDALDIPVVNTDGDGVGTVSQGVAVEVGDSTVTVTDTDGNELEVVTVVAEGSETAVAPDGTVLRDGQPYGSVPSGGSIDVPSAPTPCDDAIVELNGVEMATIPSGDTENIEVRQSSGTTLVGSKQGQHWRVGDSDIDINGTPVASVKAEDSLSIDVTQSGSPVGSWNGSEWVIPPPTINKTGMPWKTGQTVSYYAGDDGDLQLGRGADFFTLEENNYFGNTARFTDTLGGSTYANDIVIDWSTHEQDTGDVIGWYRAVVNAGTNWTSAFDNAPASVDGFAGWRVPNYHEIERVYYTEVRGITYSPFNVAASFTLWCSTTYPTDTTRAWAWLHNAIIPTRADPKTNFYRVMYCRTFNTSEL